MVAKQTWSLSSESASSTLEPRIKQSDAGDSSMTTSVSDSRSACPDSVLSWAANKAVLSASNDSLDPFESTLVCTGLSDPSASR